MSRGFVLNSASFQNLANDISSARLMLSNLLEGIADLVHKYGADPILRSESWLDEILLAPNYGIANWRNDSQVSRDLRLFLLQIVGKTPLLSDLPVGKVDVEDKCLMSEFLIEETPELEVPSAGAAMLLGDILSSIRSSEKWGNAELKIIQRCLNSGSENKFIETRATIPHISNPSHAGPVGHWLKNISRSEVMNVNDLWADRLGLFPNIEFCVEVEEQLHQLQPGIFRSVVNRLVDLDESARRWQVKEAPTPEYGFWVHPESQATLQQFGRQRQFTRTNGSIIQFKHHTRFAGEGRIYFCLDGAQRIFVVGYIGSHLDTARFN